MQIVDEVLVELARATAKFPTWPTDPLHALGVLHEEVGELSKEVLQLVYEPHKTSTAKVREEAIQAAAMALRFAMSLDTYEYTPGAQHSQGEDQVDDPVCQTCGYGASSSGGCSDCKEVPLLEGPADTSTDEHGHYGRMVYVPADMASHMGHPVQCRPAEPTAETTKCE